jgi:uncharacterized protein YecE (DUF72 family)
VYSEGPFKGSLALSFIGTAGWAIPAQYKGHFPASGSHLYRYSAQLLAVEINSSFYRGHKRTTYERWAMTVPDAFRFSVKVPRTVTQYHRLKDYGPLLDRFVEEVSGLGQKLGVLLAQLPPSLVFEAEEVEQFFYDLSHVPATVACEPRHESWFSTAADKFYRKYNIVRVAADPPRALADGKPGGNTRIAYYRLHGNPKIYYSNYESAFLTSMAEKLKSDDWCIFDNTAAFNALGNALTLQKLASS